MLLRRILEEHKTEFELFRNAAGKTGFTKEIEKLLKEFSQYNITNHSMDVLIEQLQMNGASKPLLDKMRDVKIIITELEARIGTGFVDGEGFFETLLEKIPFSQAIGQAHIYYDGYTAFTGQEFEIFKRLLQYAKRSTVVLSLDNVGKDLLESSLFHRPATTHEKIMQAAAEINQTTQAHISVETPMHFADVHRFGNEDLAHVEKFFHAPRYQPKQASGHIKVIEGAS